MKAVFHILLCVITFGFLSAQEPQPAEIKPEEVKTEEVKIEAGKVEEVKTEVQVDLPVTPALEEPKPEPVKEIVKEEAKPEIKVPVIKPVKVEPLPEVKPEIKPEKKVISTLDTMGLDDEGNWLLKRVWWEQAEATFGNILDANGKVFQLQTDYFNSRNDSDKKIAQIFIKAGYEQGEIDQALNYLLQEVQKELVLEGDLTLEEREFRELLNEKKTELEALKADLQTLSGYEASLETVINTLVDQINTARSYEKKAWSDFKEIGKVLSDKKAKILFYQMESYLKNIQNISDYIKTGLQNYFQDLLNKIETLSNSVITKVDALNQEGLNLKEGFAKLQKADELRKLERERSKEEQNRPKLKPKSKGWFTTSVDWVKSFFK